MIDDKTFSRKYADAMKEAGELYADIVRAFAVAGFPGAEVIQTGGMCLAVEVPLAGWHALVTDYQDPLPWKRENLSGFMVGIYSEQPEHEDLVAGSEGFLVYSRQNTDVRQLVLDVAPLLHRVKKAGGAA